jgi:glycosyltransferase involved in cell wall biosynthesis
VEKIQPAKSVGTRLGGAPTTAGGSSDAFQEIELVLQASPSPEIDAMQDRAEREFVMAALDLLLRGAGPAQIEISDPPYISVIVPVFSRETLVESALESLRRQTWRNFEAIVIDDASTDRTRAIVASWAEREPWIRLLANDVRSGAPASRNRGLETARGEIIAYLDSDNMLYPHALGAIAETFKFSPDVSAIYMSQLWSASGGGLEARCPEVSLSGLMAGRESVDMNVFAHRRTLFEALGGFDERLMRLADWELIIRYAKAVMPLRVPIPTSHYRHGDWSRTTNQYPFGWYRYLIEERHAEHVAHELRVLYVAAAYPQVSESYIVAEYRYMLSRGVIVEVWTDAEPAAPDPDLLTAGNVKIHRGSLAEAIAAFRPDIIHVHWAVVFEQYGSEIEEARVPVTVRGHSFDFSAALLESLQGSREIRSIYVFPTQEYLLPAMREKLKPVAVSFDPSQYCPAKEKDRRLVFRTGVALPTKDLEFFLEVARLCPQHRFVLCICKTIGNIDHLDAIVAENQRLGSPAEIHVNVPAAEVAGWMRSAGIYFHTHNPAKSFGMPISIAEALATGAYVIARNSPLGALSLGSPDRLYESLDQAAELINATLHWDDRRWAEECRKSIDHVFGHCAPERSTRRILEDWLEITHSHFLKTKEARRLETVAPGEALFFGLGGRGVETLRGGFHAPEAWGVWTGQSRASLAFATDCSRWEEVRAIEIEANFFALNDAAVPIEVKVNGRRVGDPALGREIDRHRLDIGALRLAPGQTVSVEITTPRPISPRPHGSSDRRLLGMGIRRLSFVAG